ncbi:hypothetical protein U91I_02646 [alpha proteobacterium U9-1i]|nr:hypothetical protein U91I_02646 [alpha proteobacterium U9-1i]
MIFPSRAPKRPSFLTRALSASPWVLACALALVPAAAAQTSAPTTEDRTYEAADFARYAPQNALDMLNQAPGFTIRQASTERGLGQATGNVLLNGQRISNKSEDILTQLRRIPAADVIRIEIRDGATLNIAGLSGQVANVVSRASQVRGAYAYRPEFRQLFTDPLLTRFELSVSGQAGPVQYTLALDNQASHSGAGGDTNLISPGGAHIERRHDIWTGEYNRPRVSGRFVFDGPSDSVGNLNAAFRQNLYAFEEDGIWTGPGLIDRDRRVTVTEDGWDYEVGGDYEFGFGIGRLKLIGLDRSESNEAETIVRLAYANGDPTTGDRITQDSVESERVLRAEYAWRSEPADWQVALEAAYNLLDSTTHLYSLQPSGGEVEVPFPGATAEVEENRYELLATYGRPLNRRLTMQMSAGGEYSELAQIGANGLTRTFWRPKGQVSLVWQPEDETRVNLRLQRRVGQLNFADFLASVDLNNGTTFGANADLVPPQSWEIELEAAHEMGAWGNATLRVYGAAIEDIVDIIPISATEDSVGNLDQAVRYGIEWRATTNLDPAGLEGVRLDTRLQLQASQVDDPLTGEQREISNSLLRFAQISLRHDTPETQWAWGTTLSHQEYSPSFRLTEIFHQYEIPIFGSAFVEHKDLFGLTARFSVANFFNGESFQFRTVHVDRRTDPIDYYERRDRAIGPIFSIDLRGRF